ncbi:choice-of-anchor D domain-containing protein [Novipirellula sp. SH528]|uniref:golvesin C-terminal-like domain-containing protein n=1 Tax=Novipirellula sp. SH528 TaxID=3454466 RepID=UPI003F9F9058
MLHKHKSKTVKRSVSKRRRRLLCEKLENRRLLAATTFWTDGFETAGPTLGSGIRGTNYAGPEGVVVSPDRYFFPSTSNGPTGSEGQTEVFSNITGLRHWRSERTGTPQPGSGGSPAEGIVNWTGIDIAGKSSLKFNGWFGANETASRWENGDFVRVEAQIDAQPSVTLIEFVAPTSGSGLMTRVSGGSEQLVNAFQHFQDLVIPGSGNLLNLTVTVHGDGNSEEIGFDQFTLTEEIAGVPDIEVRGIGNNEILDGDVSPSATDGTDFGNVSVTDPAIQNRTFTINNIGDGPLAISSVTTTNSDFTITANPASPVVATTGTTTFQVTFNPSAFGTRTATVNIVSDDPDETTFNFDVSGFSGPEIDVQSNGNSIADGDTTPVAADNTDFGAVSANAGMVEHTFTILNTGIDALTPGIVTVSGSDFTVTAQPATTVAPAGSTTFKIKFDPSVVGVVTGTVSIPNNDPDEAPYDFTIQGRGRGVTFWTDGFEDGIHPTEGTRITPLTGDSEGVINGSGDYFGRTDDTGSGPTADFDEVFTIQGAKYWRSERTGNGTTTFEEVINWNGIDITGRTGLQFGGFFGASDDGFRFENPDLIRVEARIDSTLPGDFVEVLEFGTQTASGNSHLGLDTTGDGRGDGTVLDNTLREFLGTIGGTGASLDLRITVRGDGNNQEIAFDQFILESDVALAPEMEVRGGGLVIADGDTTPATNDGTHFGNVSLAATAVKTFTINNVGTEVLNLIGASPFVAIGGTNPGDFSVTQIPSASLAAGTGTTSFQITFDPQASGLRTATLTIANDDADENPYNFSIQGFAGAEMDISGLTNSIASGDTTPDVADDTYFGAVNTVAGTVVHTFTISNTGADPLTLTGASPFVTIGGTNASDFTVTAIPSASIAANTGTTTFQITFDPSLTGVRNAIVSIANDDADENPYTFAIQGIGEGINFWTDNFEGTGPTTGDRDAPNHANKDDGTIRAPNQYFVRTSVTGGGANGFNQTFTNIQDGTYWRAEDVGSGGGVNPDVINWTGINITGRSELLFSGFFGATEDVSRFEPDDFILIEAKIDAGPFVKVLEFQAQNAAGNSSMAQDTNFDGLGDGSLLGLNLSRFYGSIAGLGSNLDLRITVSSGNEEEIAFDQFTLESGALPKVNLVLSSNSGTEALGTVVTATAQTDKPVVGNQTVTVGVTGTGITAGDFALSNTTITILDGQTTGSVTFTVQDDNVVEALETATLTISNPSVGLTLGPNSFDSIVITDNDKLWINEFHYEDSAGDLNEFIEVAGTAGVDLAGWTIVHYDGNAGTVIRTINLSGVIDNEGGTGFGALDFSGEPAGFDNGNDGFALVNPQGNVLEFFSYEGTFDATAGPAVGLPAVDVGALVLESGTTTQGLSLQRDNTVPGTPGDWYGPSDDSPGTLNVLLTPDTENTIGSTLAGGWNPSTSVPGFDGANYVYAKPGSNSLATFRPTIGSAGQYEVFVKYSSHANRASNVSVSVVHADGTFATTQDQRTGGGVFQSLGLFNFSVGTSGKVVVNAAGSNGIVTADSVQFVRVGNEVAAPSSNLASPTDGQSLTSVALNANGFIDVTFNSTVGLDTATVVDAGDEFTISGSGVGTAVVNGVGVLQSGTTYRYSFTGSFVPGDVIVDFTAGSFADLNTTGNLASQESFTLIDGAVRISLDNADAVRVNQWSISSSTVGYVGFDYLYTIPGGAGRLTYTPTIPLDGLYEVFANYTDGSSRASNAAYEVVSQNGTSLVRVDQRTGGGVYQSLGTFNFLAGTSGSVTLRASDANGFVVGDAVQFVRVGNTTGAPTATLVDPIAGASIVVTAINGRDYLDVTFSVNSGASLDVSTITDAQPEFTLSGAGAAGVTVNGEPTLVSGTTYRYATNGDFSPGAVDAVFAAGTFADQSANTNIDSIESFVVAEDLQEEVIVDNSSPGFIVNDPSSRFFSSTSVGGFVGSNYLAAQTGSTATATWTPTLVNSGQPYQVYVRYTSHELRATNATYVVTHNGGTTQVVVNQTSGGGTWVLLGTFTLTNGTASVQLLTQDANQYVVADAVRFVFD